MFEFECFRSSHEKLFYEILFDIKTDVLEDSVKEFSFSKTAALLQLC